MKQNGRNYKVFNSYPVSGPIDEINYKEGHESEAPGGKVTEWQLRWLKSDQC